MNLRPEDVLLIPVLYIIYRQAKRYACSGRANSVFLSVVFVALWLIFGALGGRAHVYWPILAASISDVRLWLIFLSVLFLLVIANVVIIRWAEKGADYQKIVSSAEQVENHETLKRPSAPAWVKPAVISGQVLWEEILYRGFIGVIMLLLLPMPYAVVAQGSLFALLHFLPMYIVAKARGVRPGRFVYSSLFFITLASSLFMLFNLLFGALWPGWLMHATLNNAVEASRK